MLVSHVHPYKIKMHFHYFKGQEDKDTVKYFIVLIDHTKFKTQLHQQGVATGHPKTSSY